MKLIENYVYVVTRFLKNKEEIGKEVTELIYSMLEEKHGYMEEYSETQVVEVLKELGNPNLLAIRYSNLPKQVVSEKYTTQYYYVLAIVLIFVFVVGITSAVAQTIMNPKGVPLHIIEYFGNVAFSSFTAFGVVTFIFMMLERNNKPVQIGSKFNPLDLKDIQKSKDSKSYTYKLSDIISSIVFGILGIAFLLIMNNYKLAYFDDTRFYLFDPSYWGKIVWILVGMACVDVGINTYLLMHRRKSVYTVTLRFVFSLVSSLITAWLLATPKLFHPDLIAHLAEKEFYIGLTIAEFNTGFPKVMLIAIGINVLVQTIIFVFNLSKLLLMKPNKK